MDCKPELVCLQSDWPLHPISWSRSVYKSPMDDLLPKSMYGYIFFGLVFLFHLLMNFFSILLLEFYESISLAEFRI